MTRAIFGGVAALALVCLAACGTREPTAAARYSEAKPEVSEETATAHYLANEGVLVAQGRTKIAFDPLFRNDFGTYELLPPELERALFAGEPPFDGLDAVFISHYHEDHFSPADVLQLLEERPEIRLYAPEQAVAGMRELDGGRVETVDDHITEIALAYKDPPLVIEEGGLLVEAVRIPHSGWPDRRLDVENIAYRVTLDAGTTVVHLGDADTSDAHYAHDAEHWESRHTHVAFPPYWYFQSAEGRGVLEQRLRPDHAIGIHVPADVPTSPAERPPDLRDADLFTEPGEMRVFRRE